MNPTENLEALLGGLRPRPPSPGLRRTLFPPPPPPAPVRGPAAGVWLAPLAATALLALTLATAWAPGGSIAGHALARAGARGGWEPGAVGIERNAPPQPGFRSTSTGAVSPHFAFLLLRQTNAFAR